MFIIFNLVFPYFCFLLIFLHNFRCNFFYYGYGHKNFLYISSFFRKPFMIILSFICCPYFLPYRVFIFFVIFVSKIVKILNMSITGVR